jgi:glycosyltransferase involved in cell wall biosynthesis
MTEAPDRVVSKLSAIVTAQDNERTISRCIESLRWAGEVIVVDGGSRDRTPEICSALGASVHTRSDWRGHGPQKNRALDLASNEWVLSIDSDEWVTPELRAEIERTIATTSDKAAYAIPRRSSFLGRFMRHSGWSPDYVTRLFRRETSRFTDDEGPHDRLLVNGRVGRLRQPILHEAIVDLDQMILKMNGYSRSTAALKLRQGKRATLFTALLHGGWTFFRTYVIRLGFLDGREGFMLAVANAEGSYYRYLKLMLLQRNGARDE